MVESGLSNILLNYRAKTLQNSTKIEHKTARRIILSKEGGRWPIPRRRKRRKVPKAAVEFVTPLLKYLGGTGFKSRLTDGLS
jgi:hypothetical protein